MSMLVDHCGYRDKQTFPIASPFSVIWHDYAGRVTEKRLRDTFLIHARNIIHLVQESDVEPFCDSPKQRLTCLWSDSSVRSFFESLIQSTGEEQFLAAVLGIFEGYFVELEYKSNQAALMLAALCFSLQRRSCHLVLSHENQLEPCRESYIALFEQLGVRLESNIKTPEHNVQVSKHHAADEKKPIVILTVAQKLMADYIAATPYRESGFHQKVIASHFGEKVLLDTITGIDVVLIDQSEITLIDEYLRPLVLHRPRELQGFQHALKALLAWSMSLNEADYHVQGTVAEYIGEQSLLDFEPLQKLAGIWSSERVLNALSSSVLSAVYAYQEGRDYLIQDQKICVLNPETGSIVPGKVFPDWIRQGIEVKEGLEISAVSEVLLRKSYQAFFRERLHLAGTGTSLACSRRELFALFGCRLLSFAATSCYGSKTKDIFFDPEQLTEAVSSQLKAMPSVRYLICPDPLLFSLLERVLSEKGNEFISIELIKSIRELSHTSTDKPGCRSTSQVIVFGLSPTGREELYLKCLFQGAVIRMLPRSPDDNRLIGYLMPDFIDKYFYFYRHQRQTRRKRAELLADQLRMLQSEYGLRDQWV